MYSPQTSRELVLGTLHFNTNKRTRKHRADTIKTAENDIEQPLRDVEKNEDEFDPTDCLDIHDCVFCCGCPFFAQRTNSQKLLNLLLSIALFISFEQNVITATMGLYQRDINEDNLVFDNTEFGYLFMFMTLVDLLGRPLTAWVIQNDVDEYIFLFFLALFLAIADIGLFAFMTWIGPTSFVGSFWDKFFPTMFVLFAILFVKTFSDSKNVFTKVLLEQLAPDDKKISTVQTEKSLSYFGGTMGFTLTLIFDQFLSEGSYKLNHVWTALPLFIIAGACLTTYQARSSRRQNQREQSLEKNSTSKNENTVEKPAPTGADLYSVGSYLVDNISTTWILPFLYFNHSIFMSQIQFAIQFLKEVHNTTEGTQVLLSVSVPYLAGIILGNWIIGGIADIMRMNKIVPEASGGNIPYSTFCLSCPCCIVITDECDRNLRKMKEAGKHLEEMDEQYSELIENIDSNQRVEENALMKELRLKNKSITYGITFFCNVMSFIFMTIYFKIYSNVNEYPDGGTAFAIIIFVLSFFTFASPAEQAVVYSLEPIYANWAFVITGLGYVASITVFIWLVGVWTDDVAMQYTCNGKSFSDVCSSQEEYQESSPEFTAECKYIVNKLTDAVVANCYCFNDATTCHGQEKVSAGYESSFGDVALFGIIGCFFILLSIICSEGVNEGDEETEPCNPTSITRKLCCQFKDRNSVLDDDQTQTHTSQQSTKKKEKTQQNAETY